MRNSCIASAENRCTGSLRWSCGGVVSHDGGGSNVDRGEFNVDGGSNVDGGESNVDEGSNGRPDGWEVKERIRID